MHCYANEFSNKVLCNSVNISSQSILVPVYKGKGNPLVCGSYRAIKLLEQPMKVLGRVLKRGSDARCPIDNIQFGFMPGKGTTDAIFIMRQVQEKTPSKEEEDVLCFCGFRKSIQ